MPRLIFTVEDAGSRNGTFVNGERVERRALEHGDRVRLGQRLELEYREDDAGTQGRGDDRGRRASGSSRNDDDDRDEAPAWADSDADVAVDVDASRAGDAKRRRGGGAGWLRERRFLLLPADGDQPATPIRSAVTTVGRDANAGVRLEDDSVSRMHARLDRDGGALRVTDLKSRNGVHVNDERVLRERLEHGDRVRFGDVEMELVATSGWAWGRIAALSVAVLAVI